MDYWDFNIKVRNGLDIFKKEFLKKPVRISFLIIFYSLFLLGFAYMTFKYYERKNNARYTIGITIKLWGGKNESVDYYYVVNGKRYEGNYSFGANHPIYIINERYFVLFSSENPENSQMLYTPRVPDSILIAPKDGWTVLPIKFE